MHTFTSINVSWPEFTASVTFELFKQKPTVMEKSLAILNISSKLRELLPGSLGLRKTDLNSDHCKFLSLILTSFLFHHLTNMLLIVFILSDVRMRYQNKNLALPHCAAEGNHLEGSPEFCTFRAFQALVKELTPGNWEEECVPPTPL